MSRTERQSEHLPTISGMPLLNPSSTNPNGTAVLLTVVLHELGHLIGLSHITTSGDSHSLMSDHLEVGSRSLPSPGELAELQWNG